MNFPWAKQKQNGFTIIELLIVIVVIAILAAIIFVAYSGIQARAHASIAQADAEQLAKLLALSNVTNGGYPSDLSTINNGSSLPSSDGTTYAYHQQNGGTNYCVTVTNTTSSYMITDANTAPTAGGCPGDGQGGQSAITNLVTNPSFESGTSGWIVGNSAETQSTTGASSGSYAVKVTPTSSTTSDSFIQIGSTSALLSGLTAGSTYTISGSLYLNAVQTGSLDGRARRIVIYGWTTPSTASLIGQSTQAPNSTGSSSVSMTFTIPSADTGLTLRLYDGGENTADNSVYWDSIMMTAGSMHYNYADGNSPSWIWNGAANASTSTGPAQ